MNARTISQHASHEEFVRSRWSVRWAIFGMCCAGLLVVLQTVGCAGYQVGSQSLFSPQFRTVHVSQFQSDTLRRGLGEWLTEAVVKEIEAQTPYKVVSQASADTMLSGRIISANKRVLAETINDDPRNLEFELYVEVRWIDRNGNLLMQQAPIPIPRSAVAISESGSFIPEAGQSRTSVQLRDIRRLAKQIVGQMEFTPL